MNSTSETQRKELTAFFSFFSTFNLVRTVTSVADLTDGAALFEVLTLVYVLCIKVPLVSLRRIL